MSDVFLQWWNNIESRRAEGPTMPGCASRRAWDAGAAAEREAILAIIEARIDDARGAGPGYVDVLSTCAIIRDAIKKRSKP